MRCCPLVTGFGAPVLVSDRSAGGAVTTVAVMLAPQPLARVPGDRWPEEHVVAVSWIISGWVYVELRVAGAVARALPDPVGRGLGRGQVKRIRTCVVGAAGSGL